MNEDTEFFEGLKAKALWVRQQTLEIHRISQETRVASSLSAVEMFVALYYGGLLEHDAKDPLWDGRDRLIISKGHGSISLYPILAERGYFSMDELKRVGMPGSFLGGIPDPIIPGYETVNGSLGHGLGIACGIAIALKRQKKDKHVFVILGDGELYEGSVWEAIMFAAEHKLDNLTVILDNNKICMLDYCKEILDMDPLADKFKAFRWVTDEIDGHDIKAMYESLKTFKSAKDGKPHMLIANTLKGKGVECLEGKSLCHIFNVKPDDVDGAIKDLPQ
jgi:transketolase